MVHAILALHEYRAVFMQIYSPTMALAMVEPIRTGGAAAGRGWNHIIDDGAGFGLQGTIACDTVNKSRIFAEYCFLQEGALYIML